MRLVPLFLAVAVAIGALYVGLPDGSLEHAGRTALRRVATGLAALRLPCEDGDVWVAAHPCLSRPGAVTVAHDEHGVPHVLGDTVADALFGQGFVTAQARLWQLELYRRAASGRVSEAVGAEGLVVDRHSRTMGFMRAGAADWEALQARAAQDAGRAAQDAAWLSCFTAGINAQVTRAAAAPPLEFLLLGIAPQPFTEAELLAISRFVCSSLTVGIGVEPVNSYLLDILGPEKLSEWTHGYDHEQWPSVLDGAGLEGLVDGNGLRQPQPTVPQMLSFGPGLGSNAWAVSGNHTASGKPILAGDPHLPVTCPAMFMQAHVATRQLGDDGHALWNATGVFIPGLPGIFIGHTEFSAWSITTSSHDGEDFFVEQLKPCGGGGRCYLYRDQLLPLVEHEERIVVKGGPTETLLVQETHHGPIFTRELFPALRRPMAYASVAMKASMQAVAFVRANLARDWPAFRAEVQLLRSAQVNLLYADAAGDIAYQLLGTVPLRAAGHGILPAPGWTGTHEWTGEVPLEDMPHVVNPAKGWVASANNCPVRPEETPYFLGAVFMSAYRAKRIHEVLAAQVAAGDVGLDASQALQEDGLSLPAAEFTRVLLQMRQEGDGWKAGPVQEAMELLRQWDPPGRMDADSAAACVFHATARELARVLLETEPSLDEAATRLLLGAPANPLKPSTELLKHDLKNMLRMLQAPEESHWMQAAGGVQEAVPAALARAMALLHRTLGPSAATWRWGVLHAMDVQHAFHAVPLLGNMLSRTGLEMAGDSHTPMQTASSVRRIDNQATDAFAPAYRLLVDTADLAHGLHQMTPGNSGLFGSPHYDDAVEEVAKGIFRPMLFTDEDVAAGTVAFQTLLFEEEST